MKKIIKELRGFLALYSPIQYLLMLIFCSATLILNFGLNLESEINKLPDIQEFLAFFLIYSMHLTVGYAIILSGKFSKNVPNKKNFYILAIASAIIFAFRSTSIQHFAWIESFSDPEKVAINKRIFSDIFRFLYLFVPVSLIWWSLDKENSPYGFSLKQHNTRIYFVLLLMMIPLIVGASFLSSFLDYYPRAAKLAAYDANRSEYLLFELFYGLDFVSIEYFFRGFLVMALGRYVGIHAIFPMACFYMSIHFGKPLGEAISSFFGGTILGVISFHTRSIYGGIMVHVGIAWLMELGAYIGNLIRS